MIDVCFYLTHYPACKAYKFFFLAEELRKIGVSSEIILCSTEVTGVDESDIRSMKKYVADGYRIYIMNIKQVLRRVRKKRYNIFIVGTYSGNIDEIIKCAKSKGATTVELSTIGFNDSVEHDVDEYWLTSKLSLKAALNKRPGRAKKALKKKIHYVGAILSDDIPNTYTTDLRSVKDFKSKYQCDKYFIWMPGREDLTDLRFQKILVKSIPKGSNLLLKPHPWSWKLHIKYIKSVSRIIKVITPEDSYWGIKGMDCAIGRNSTAGIELAAMSKPILYIDKRSRRKFLRKFVKPIGPVCSVNDVSKTLSEELCYSDKEYNKFLNKIYPSPYKMAWINIVERIQECIKTKK